MKGRVVGMEQEKKTVCFVLLSGCPICFGLCTTVLSYVMPILMEDDDDNNGVVLMLPIGWSQYIAHVAMNIVTNHEIGVNLLLLWCWGHNLACCCVATAAVAVASTVVATAILILGVNNAGTDSTTDQLVELQRIGRAHCHWGGKLIFNSSSSWNWSCNTKEGESWRRQFHSKDTECPSTPPTSICLDTL